MNYENRLSGQSLDNLTALALTDIVSGMTARANGIITALQSALSSGEIEMDSGSIISALESVSLEIEDIQEIVRQFYQAHREVKDE